MTGIPASIYAQRRRKLAEQLKLAPDDLPGGGNFHPEEDVLELLAAEVDARRPEDVVCLGGGLGSVVIARGLALLGHGRVWIIEDDLRRMTLTREMLSGIDAEATLVDAELDPYDDHNLWYMRHLMGRLPAKIDMMFIDGPGHFAGRAPRWPSGPELFPRLSPHGVVILDDGKRVKEKKALQLWGTAFPDLEQHQTKTSGGAVILQRR